MLTQMIDYIQNNIDSILARIFTHLVISITSLLIAMLLGIFIGVLIVKFKSYQKIVVSIFSLLKIVPSLAILILLMPIIGTGAKSAIVALVLLGIPPILMNTVIGLESVPEFILETAYACGMNEFQVWYKVKLPLAMPLIIAGIKTSLIEIIASATLAARIGAGGLGEIIFTGIGLYRMDLLLIGGLLVALMSLVASLIFEIIDKLLLKYKNA